MIHAEATPSVIASGCGEPGGMSDVKNAACRGLLEVEDLACRQ